MGCINEEQNAFEQMVLRDFKMWSSSELNNFNNYSIIIAKKVTISSALLKLQWLVSATKNFTLLLDFC